MKLQEIYWNDAHMYSVCKSDRSDNLILHTLSGGILMFSTMIELRPEEVELFQSVGHLDGLAYYVARHDPIVEGRYIKPQHENEKIEFVAALDETVPRWAEALLEHQTVVRVFLAKCQAIPQADWHRPEAPGKWSPAAVVLHVCRTYELGRDAAAGGTGMRLLVAPSAAWLARMILLPFSLATGRFPQGAKAPAEVVPDIAEAGLLSPEAAAARLLRATQEAATALRRAAAEHPSLRISHAYFGPLKPHATLRLLSAHTRHHSHLLGNYSSRS